MKSFITLAITLISLLGITGLSWAQGACMVSGLEGQATVFHDKDQPRSINKFKKLWPGDQLEISKETTVQLDFLAFGRVETWKGPVRIVIEEKDGRAQNDAQQPTITNTGNLTPDLKNSTLLNQQNIAGQISVRGALTPQIANSPLDQQGQKELERIQNMYNSLLQKNVNGNVTADMYYLAALEGLGQKELMARHIYKLLSLYGSNVELEEMLNAL